MFSFFKGSFFSRVFSIRSFGGSACNVKMIAAFAETVCTKPESKAPKYLKSKCHTKSLKVLGGKDGREVLTEQLKSLSGTTKSMFCKIKEMKSISICQ